MQGLPKRLDLDTAKIIPQRIDFIPVEVAFIPIFRKYIPATGA